jgi:hypothetical protein
MPVVCCVSIQEVSSLRDKAVGSQNSLLRKAEDHEFGYQEAAKGNEQTQAAEAAEEGTVPTAATLAFLV